MATLTPHPAAHLKPKDKSPALVFGHADADGHLAAEQTRINLEAAGIRVEKLIVGPQTRNYRFWERAFSSQEFEEFRLVVAVDIAFSFRNPSRSLEVVLQTVDTNPFTEFVLIDHHPLQHPEQPRSNLTLVEVDSAYGCCFGQPSDDLMVVAALCDGDKWAVRPLASSKLKKRAIGVRRAAADCHGLAGSGLLTLLHNRRWEVFEALAEESPEFHMSARGRRRDCGPQSPVLEALKTGSISMHSK